jgi:asparagine synthase (glutamine-hydrolysing)
LAKADAIVPTMPAPNGVSVSNGRLCDPVLDSSFDQKRGWSHEDHGEVALWIKGHVGCLGHVALANQLVEAAGRSDRVAQLLRELDGHFAFAASGPDWHVAAVDRVRSVPLFVASCGDRGRLAAAPVPLIEEMGLERVSDGAALALAMAGYTIGNETLFEGLRQLGPGEFAIATPDGSIRIERYHRYEPWRIVDRAEASRREELGELTLSVIRKAAASVDGRPIVVPLSAGRDSRLIVSALRQIGYDNVRTFTYGRAANKEISPAREVAARLGYPWRFIPMTVAGQRAYFAGEDHRKYWSFADTCAATPFHMDLPAILDLQRDGYIPDDAVVINGQTGDFISGNHIPAGLQRPLVSLSPAARREAMMTAHIGKHFRLWDALTTPDNDRAIRGRLDAMIDEHGLDFDAPDTVHGIAEFLEFQGRQAKYVINGQRVYEYAGLDWRLPLWDRDYLDFWEGVPLAAKARQKLYREMLAARDWGGVWRDIPVNPPSSFPPMLGALRFFCKLVHAPLGRGRWHRFERRYFQYWTETIAAQVWVPYVTVRRDTRGARHGVAWLTEAYLNGKGRAYDGGVLEGPPLTFNGAGS